MKSLVSIESVQSVEGGGAGGLVTCEWFLSCVTPHMDLESIGGQEWFAAASTLVFVVSKMCSLVGLEITWRRIIPLTSHPGAGKLFCHFLCNLHYSLEPREEQLDKSSVTSEQLYLTTKCIKLWQ